MSRDPLSIKRIHHVRYWVGNAKQAAYSTIKRFAIVPRDFTQESGELTPTLKVKRKVVTKNYQALLDSFYAD